MSRNVSNLNPIAFRITIINLSSFINSENWRANELYFTIVATRTLLAISISHTLKNYFPPIQLFAYTSTATDMIF